MDTDKWRTYLADTILLIASAIVFVVQGTSKQPNLTVIAICVVILIGRVGIAVASIFGNSPSNTTSQSLSGTQSTSQDGLRSSQGQSNETSS